MSGGDEEDNGGHEEPPEDPRELQHWMCSEGNTETVEFCHWVTLHASGESEIWVIVYETHVHVYIDDLPPFILEPRQLIRCSGLVRVHGIDRKNDSQVCYRHVG